MGYTTVQFDLGFTPKQEPGSRQAFAFSAQVSSISTDNDEIDFRV